MKLRERLNENRNAVKPAQPELAERPAYVFPISG